MNNEPIIILITCQDLGEAKRIAESLVHQKLIACGNILPQISSVFQWKSKIEHEEESLLIAKSRRPLFEQIVEQVRSLHSYETPEIIALPVIAGSPDYLAWLFQETGGE